MLDNLNGWQRLWLLLTILWLGAVGYLTYPNLPSTDTGLVAGCYVPYEMFSLSAPSIIKEELRVWRQELPAQLNAKHAEIDSDSNQKVGELMPFSEGVGYWRFFPEWRGDPIKVPDWAREPWVKRYCESLLGRLERSGRANQMREATSTAILKLRINWFLLAFAEWIGPCIAIYLLGFGIAWVRRGFQNQPIDL